MELNIRAGKRVLYKKNNSWKVGELAQAKANLNEDGLFLPVYPQEVFAQLHSNAYNWNEIEYDYANINDLFLDAVELEPWMKDYSDCYMTKEDYCKFVQSEDFNKALETSYVSDGEYYYYPVSKYNENWIMKQPFSHVVRSNT